MGPCAASGCSQRTELQQHLLSNLNTLLTRFSCLSPLKWLRELRQWAPELRWLRELRQWAPELRVIMLHDSGRSPAPGSNPDHECSHVDSDLEALMDEDEEAEEDEGPGGTGRGRRKAKGGRKEKGRASEGSSHRPDKCVHGAPHE
eukprot:1161068-Pelagomonas_calceolata.AAC.2